MDIKITGIFEIMEKALDQAKDGREHILVEMNKAIKTSRKSFKTTNGDNKSRQKRYSYNR